MTAATTTTVATAAVTGPTDQADLHLQEDNR